MKPIDLLRVDVDAIKQALKEKVYPVVPLHIGVDVHSTEGVVFMKLANKNDAKAAFTALHGDWYSGTPFILAIHCFLVLNIDGNSAARAAWFLLPS